MLLTVPLFLSLAPTQDSNAGDGGTKKERHGPVSFAILRLPNSGFGKPKVGV